MNRSKYHSKKLFRSIEKVKNAVSNAWHSIDASYIRVFYEIISTRLHAYMSKSRIGDEQHINES